MKKRAICLFLALLFLFLLFSCGQGNNTTYVLNLSSKKVHRENCIWAEKIASKNRSYSSKDLIDIINAGFSPCKVCLE